MLRWLLAALAAASVVTGCENAPSDKGPYPVMVMDVAFSDREMLLSLGACNDQPEQVVVFETDDEVHIKAASTSKESKGACANSARAVLGRVVGPRKVIDDFDGSTMPCGINRCVWARGQTPPRPAVSRFIRPYSPRQPGSASIPWSAPIWHKQDKYLDIAYFPGCHNAVAVEVRERSDRVLIRVVREILRSTAVCGYPAVARIPLSAPIGGRSVVHDAIDGAQLPPRPASWLPSGSFP